MLCTLEKSSRGLLAAQIFLLSCAQTVEPIVGTDGGVEIVQYVAAGESHSCGLRRSAVFCWGANGSGQTGPETRSGPQRVGVEGAIRLALGAEHSCALRGTNEVMCWGGNASGQLGDGTTLERATASRVASVDDAVALAAGEHHTCIVRASGSVACWGENQHGELGDGFDDNIRTTPVRALGVEDAIDVAAGNAHTCALHRTGRVSCWGWDAQGQLGDGEADGGRPVPQEVVGVTDATSLACGAYHTCVRRSSGVVLCWGRNLAGQLGDETLDNRPIPAPVSGLDRVVEISAGETHTCARTDSGSVYCWGDNDVGQIGDASHISRLMATPSMLEDTQQIAVGARHSCSVREGAVWCWGDNSAGQLGVDGAAARAEPIELTHWE